MKFNRHKILFLSREGVTHPTALIEYLADKGFSSRSQYLYLLQGKVRRYFSSNAMISELRRTISEFSPDVIVFNDENSRAGLFAIMRANRKASKPIIWFRGAVGGYNALSPIDLYLIKHKNLARLLVRSYAMINNWNASLTMRFLVSKTQVECSHHFVERTTSYDEDLSGMRAKWGIASDDIVIGSIANARPIKNIEFAAKAVSRVKSNKRIQFLYIGAYDDSFKKRLENLNPGNTIVTGPIPEAKRYAGVFDIFVSPTKEPGEGFGLAITEAMMSSVPVVATQFGGATDIVEHGKTGFLLPENALSWENALQKLADDADLRKQMGRAAQIRVLDRFSLDVVAANFIRILNDVIAENQ